jgi:DNA-binding response OmpR family regulator
MRLLVAEDDRKVASFLRQGLEEEGYAVEVAGDGAAALDLILADPPFDLVILDVMMPRRDGFAVLKSVRERRIETPVLILTARDAVPDRVTGLDLGADDYLTKPFAFDELLARVRALLRRGQGRHLPVMQVADLTLDPATRAATRGTRRIELTAREYVLLERLMRHAGRVQSRAALTEHVWGLSFDPGSNVVDVYVGYLRRKVDGPGERRLIHTLRGAGYVLRGEP